MSSFRFASKTVLLTYSQVDNETINAFLSPASHHFDHVASTLRTPCMYRLGREQHQDGGTHFHVFLSFGERVNSRNERLFDFGSSHPNIQIIRRTPEKAFDYAGKDGDIIYEHGERPGESGTLSSGRDSIWADALSAEHKEDFLGTLRNRAPRDYVLYFDAIERFADRHYTPPQPEYRSPSFETIERERVEPWLQQSGINDGTRHGRVRSLILWGPTRTGKTVWSRSLGKATSSRRSPAPFGAWPSARAPTEVNQ